MSKRPTDKPDRAAWDALRELERFGRREMLPVMVAATILFLWGSFGHFLPSAGMSPLDPVALAAFAMLAIGGLVAALLSATGRLTQALLVGLLSFLIAELHVPGTDSLAIGLLGMAVGLWKPRLFARLVGVIFAVVLIGSLFAARATPHDPLPAPAAGKPGLPPVLHLILDEVGPDAPLPADRFTRWTQAHSRYHVTRASLPEMTDRFYELLVDQGYALEVWRTDYVVSCPEGAACTQYRNFHVDALRDQPLSLARKAQLVLYAWIRTGQRLEHVGDGIDPMVGASHISPLTSLAALDRAAARAASLRPGEALSVHLLLPHYPYILAPDCTLKPDAQWVGRSPAFPVERRRAGYADQLACVTQRVAGIGRDDMVIIVHGDHGTRYFDMTAAQTDRPHREEMLRQAFSTTFALHLPGQRTTLMDSPASVSSLLEDLAIGGFDRLPTGRPESLFEGEGPTFREVER